MLDFRSILKHLIHATAFQIQTKFSTLSALFTSCLQEQFLLQLLSFKQTTWKNAITSWRCADPAKVWFLGSVFLSVYPRDEVMSFLHQQLSWHNHIPAAAGIWPLDLWLETEKLRGRCDIADCIGEFIYSRVTW